MNIEPRIRKLEEATGLDPETEARDVLQAAKCEMSLPEYRQFLKLLE